MENQSSHDRAHGYLPSNAEVGSAKKNQSSDPQCVEHARGSLFKDRENIRKRKKLAPSSQLWGQHHTHDEEYDQGDVQTVLKKECLCFEILPISLDLQLFVFNLVCLSVPKAPVQLGPVDICLKNRGLLLIFEILKLSL